MFKSKRTESKILTPDKAYGNLSNLDLVPVVIEAMGISAIGVGLGTGLLGASAISVGAGMHTAPSPNPMADVTMKAGGIALGAGMGLATVGGIVANYVKDAYALDEKSDTKKEQVLPFSERRLAKYQNNQKTIESFSKKEESKIMQNRRERTSNSKKESQFSI